jgi:hypothetical protein
MFEKTKALNIRLALKTLGIGFHGKPVASRQLYKDA